MAINELQPSDNLVSLKSLKFRSVPFGPPIVRDNEYQNPGRLKFCSDKGNAYGQNEQANFYFVDTMSAVKASDNWRSGPSKNSLATDFYTEHCGFFTSPGGPSCRWKNWSGAGNPHKHSGLAAAVSESEAGKIFLYDVGHAAKTSKDMECYEYGVVGMSGLMFPDHDNFYSSDGEDDVKASIGVQHIYGMYRCDLTPEKYEELEDIETGLQKRLEEILAWLEDVNPGSTDNRLFSSIRSKGFKQGVNDAVEEGGYEAGKYGEGWSFKNIIDSFDWKKVRKRIEDRKNADTFFDPKFGRRLNDILDKVNIPNNKMGHHMLTFLVEAIQAKLLKVDASANIDKAQQLFEVLNEKGHIDGKDIFNWVLRSRMGDEEYIDKYQGKFTFDNIFNWFKGIDLDTELTVGETYFLYNCFFHGGIKDKDMYGRYTCLIDGENYTYNQVNYSEDYTGPVVDEPEQHAYSVAEAAKESYAPEPTFDDINLFSDTEDNVINSSDYGSIYSLEEYCRINNGVMTTAQGKPLCDLLYYYNPATTVMTEKNYQNKKEFEDWCSVQRASTYVKYQEYSECLLDLYSNNQGLKTFKEYCQQDLSGRYGTHVGAERDEFDPFGITKEGLVLLPIDQGTPPDYPPARDEERCYFNDGTFNFPGYLWNIGKKGFQFWAECNVMAEGVEQPSAVFSSSIRWEPALFFDRTTYSESYLYKENYLTPSSFYSVCTGQWPGGGSRGAYSGIVSVENNQIMCRKYDADYVGNDSIGIPDDTTARLSIPVPNMDTYWVPDSLFTSPGTKIIWSYEYGTKDYYKEASTLEKHIKEDRVPVPEWNKYSGKPTPLVVEPKTILKATTYGLNQQEYDHTMDAMNGAKLTRSEFRQSFPVSCITSDPQPPTKGSDCVKLIVYPHNGATFSYEDLWYVNDDGEMTPLVIGEVFVSEKAMNDNIRENQDDWIEDMFFQVGDNIIWNSKFENWEAATRTGPIYKWRHKNKKLTEYHKPFVGWFSVYNNSPGHTAGFENTTNQRQYHWFWEYTNTQTSYSALKNKPYKTSTFFRSADELYNSDKDLTQFPLTSEYTQVDWYWHKRFEDFCDSNFGTFEGNKLKAKRFNPDYTCNFDKAVRAVETKTASGLVIPPTNPELLGLVKVTFRDFQRNNYFEDDFCENLEGATYREENKSLDVTPRWGPSRKFYFKYKEGICDIPVTGISNDQLDFEEWIKKYKGTYYESFKLSDVDEDFYHHSEEDVGKEVGVFEAAFYPFTLEEYQGNDDNNDLFGDFEEWCEACVDKNNKRITSLGYPSFQPSDDYQFVPEKLPTQGYSKNSFYKKNVADETETCYVYRDDIIKVEKNTSVLPLSFRQWCTNLSPLPFGYITQRKVIPGWEYDFEDETWSEMDEELLPVCFNPFMINAGVMNKYFYDNISDWQDLNYYCKRSNADFFRNKSFWPDWLINLYDYFQKEDETLDSQRAVCAKLIDVEWDYTFEDYCEKNDGVLGDTESEDGIPLGYGCTFEGVGLPYLEEFWDDGVEGFRFWCALNGGLNVNGANPGASDEVNALFEGDGCQITIVSPENPEEEEIKFYTYSDTGGFRLPYFEFLPYLKTRSESSNIIFGEKDYTNTDEGIDDSVSIVKVTDLHKYTPETKKIVHNLGTTQARFVYPLEKLYNEKGYGIVYRSNGVDKKPTFKDVTYFIGIPLNFNNSETAKLGVENPGSNKFVVQLWYTKDLITEENASKVNMTAGPTAGPGETIGTSIGRNFSYVYFTEINPNGNDEDYIRGKELPLGLFDPNLNKGWIYPTHSYDTLPDWEIFLKPQNVLTTTQYGTTTTISAQKGDFDKAVGLQAWWTDSLSADMSTKVWTKGDRIEFNKETTLPVEGKYLLMTLIDPTFKEGQTPVSRWIDGIGPKDTKGVDYVTFTKAASFDHKAYWTDSKNTEPNWNYYSKPFSGPRVRTTESRVFNNSGYEIQLYFQEAPLDPTSSTNRVVKLDHAVFKTGSSINVKPKDEGFFIFVAVAPDSNINDWPKNGMPVDIDIQDLGSGTGNTQMVWQEKIGTWEDPFDIFSTDIGDGTNAEAGYLEDYEDLEGKKFEKDSVYTGSINTNSQTDVFLQIFWTNSKYLNSLSNLKPGSILEGGNTPGGKVSEFVALDQYAFFGSYKNRFTSRSQFGPVRYINTTYQKKQGDGSKGNATAYWGQYSSSQPPNWSKYNKPIKYVRVIKGSTYRLNNKSVKDYELTCYFSDTPTPPSTITTDWAKRTATLTGTMSTLTTVARGEYMFVFADTPQNNFDGYIDIQNEVDWGSDGRKVVLGVTELDNQGGASGASGVEWPGSSGGASGWWDSIGASMFPGASFPGSSTPDIGSSRPSIGASGGHDGVISGGFLFRLIYDTLNRFTQQELDDLGYVASWLLAIAIEEFCIILYATGLGEILAVVAMVMYGAEAIAKAFAGKFRKVDVVAEFSVQADNNELLFGKGANRDNLGKFCKWPDLQARFVNIYANEYIRAYLKYTFCRSNGYLIHLTADARRTGPTHKNFDRIRIMRMANIANTYSFGFFQMEAPKCRKILRRYYDSFEPIGNYPPGSEGGSVSDSDWGSGDGTKNYSKDLGVEYETALELDLRKDTIRNQPHWNEEEMWFKIDLSRAIRGEHQKKVMLRGGNNYYIGKLGTDTSGDSANNQSWVNGVTETDIGVEPGAYAWNLFNGHGAGTKYKSYYDEVVWGNKKHKTWAWEVYAGEPDWWPIQIPAEGGIPGVEFNMMQYNADKKDSSESDGFRIYSDWQLNFMHLTFIECSPVKYEHPETGEEMIRWDPDGKYRVFPVDVDPNSDIDYKLRKNWQTDPDKGGAVTHEDQLLNPYDSVYMRMKAYAQGPSSGNLYTNEHGVDGKIYPHYKFVGFSTSASLGTQANLARFRSFVFKYFRPLLWVNGRSITLNEARENGTYVVPNFKKDIYDWDTDLGPWTTSAEGNLTNPLTIPATPITPDPTPNPTPPSGGYGY